ncbi:uncharacterized protein EKO05_0010013 [Ascochyta rabiei]|uniref:uncharacterized protein n=1 Tax=Didymella rabiei TaxID=5454 RepID=UPI002202295C|nr:uncharacterized protein EKO05_0010013 [Ascochyta rabiei]UPX19760.1 hypothetical protein EKO05_0010013 [Ascochyta rabiei]
MVKDRVCYLVAVRAQGQDEFYLEEPLPDRKYLREAVEADISRATLLISKWPTEFFDADVAAKYVAGVFALNRFDYTPFEGVAAEKFQGYVTFNTARHAFAVGMFELKVERKDWTRKEKNAGLKKLNEAVEFNVCRVLNLIPSSLWPSTFSDVNEARNFVARYCHDIRFRYTGWPDVALTGFNGSSTTTPRSETTTSRLGHNEADDFVDDVSATNVNGFDDDYKLTSATPTPPSEASDSPATAGAVDDEVEEYSADQKESLAVDPFNASTLTFCYLPGLN